MVIDVADFHDFDSGRADEHAGTAQELGKNNICFAKGDPEVCSALEKIGAGGARQNAFQRRGAKGATIHPKYVCGGAFDDFAAIVQEESFISTGVIRLCASENLAEFVTVLEGGERIVRRETEGGGNDLVTGGTTRGWKKGHAERGMFCAAR